MRSCAGIASLAIVMALGGFPLLAKDQPTPVAQKDRLLVLPVEFACFNYNTAGRIKVLPDRSERAELNLESSLQRALKRHGSEQFVALPELSAEQRLVVGEHTELLQLIAAGTTADVMERVAAPFDYSIGNGLAFLAERSGADRAIFVSGLRGNPSIDVAVMLLFSQSIILPVGNRKALSALVVDLRTGDVLRNFVPERGFAGEADDVAGANTWMHAVFDVVPETVRTEPRWDGPVALEEPVRHPRPRRGFVVMRPSGWKTSDSAHRLCFRRHRSGLESICVYDKSLEDALLAEQLTPDAEPMKVAEVAIRLLKSDPGYTEMEVVSVTPARVAGRDGFRIQLASRLNLAGSNVREGHVVYGVTGSQGVYLVRFEAPAIYYFEHYLPEFEAMIGTFKLL